MTNNWPKKLGEVADILMGQSPPSSTYNNEGVGLPFFQGKAEFGDLYPKVDRYCSVPVRIAENRDILLSVRAPVGPINIAQEKTCIGRGLSAIRAKKEQANQWYLYYLLKQHEDNWEGSSGSTFQAINKTTIENLQIPLPNLNAQKIIVERLDVIRKAQELCDTQISKTEELFKSLFISSITDGVEKKLGELFDRQSKIILPTKTPDKEFNFIGLENIESNTGNLINFQVGKGNGIKSNKSVFQKGDILYGKLRPYLNKVWLADFDGICSTDIWVLRPNSDNINALVLSTLLRSQIVVKRMSSIMTGTNLPRANSTSFDILLVKIPTINNQKSLTEGLEAIQEYKKLLFKQKTLLKELFDSVLYKSMKGEID